MVVLELFVRKNMTYPRFVCIGNSESNVLHKHGTPVFNTNTNQFAIRLAYNPGEVICLGQA